MQTLPGKGIKKVLDCLRRVHQPPALLYECRDRFLPMFVQQIGNEEVRRERSNRVSRQHLTWEVPKIERDNHLRFGVDRRRENMAVIRVWKRKRFN